MSNSPGPGEYIPSPRNEAGNRVLFYSALGADKEPAAISSVNNNPPAADNIADIVIDSDGRTESGVPFAWGDYQPERGYVRDDEIHEGGERRALQGRGRPFFQSGSASRLPSLCRPRAVLVAGPHRRAGSDHRGMNLRLCQEG